MNKYEYREGSKEEPELEVGELSHGEG